ncbi:MAG TPA: hypothetical protein V6C81_05540 [Planktothrix sp.]
MLTHNKAAKILLPAAMVGFSVCAAMAQNVRVLHKVEAPGAANQWGRAPAKGNDVDVTSLREPVQLQDLPAFTGHATFVNGHVHESDNGPSWLMTFKVKESPQQVMEWYRNVLRMQQWNIKQSTSDTICATKKNSQCTIAVNNFRTKEYQTHLEIMYFLSKNR